MTTPEIGTILRSRYVLKEQLGKNATRQTWLAQDREQNTAVVVKMLAFNLQLQWQEVKLFEREAQALQKLNHPRIPKYLDYFTVESQPSWMTLVQSYVPGESLQAQLDRGMEFDEERLRQIASDILTILSYLHDRQPPVLHRDIKPSNLMVGEGNQTYLVDFGAAQIQPAQMGTFTVVGTYGYTPMEQFGGRAVPSSDLYSLGATLVHLATGIPPADLPQKEFRIDYCDRVRLSLEFMQWLDKLIEPGVGDRHSSALDATKELSQPQLVRSDSRQQSRELVVNISNRTQTAPTQRLYTHPSTEWKYLNVSDKISRILYRKTSRRLSIRFKTHSLFSFLRFKKNISYFKEYNWKDKCLIYFGVWLISSPLFFFNLMTTISLLLIAAILIHAFLDINYVYNKYYSEILISASQAIFLITLNERGRFQELLSTDIEELESVYFRGLKSPEDSRPIEFIQIEVLTANSSPEILVFDASLHTAELELLQQMVNNLIQDFRGRVGAKIL